MIRVFLGLGSNLGDREANFKEAIKRLSTSVNIDKVSSIYESEPVGYSEQPLFLNMVVSGNTRLEPVQLLEFVKKIEKEMGRVPSFRNAPRPVDIDILFYDNSVVDLPMLIIPHAGLEERSFVLVPMAEIAPELVHPVDGKPVKDLLNKLVKINGLKSLKKFKSPAEE
jgi:2-amino-4-hydroxy-6-hydroxymethyldihydropteridine diphosphokinase